MHLVGFTIEIYCDVRSNERQINAEIFQLPVQLAF
jgi:hypothetical protein